MLPISTLLKTGFTPTLIDFNNLLIFLSRNKKFKSIINIVSQLNSNLISVDAHTHTLFTKALLKENRYQEAADFLQTIVGKSNFYHKNRIFDALIQGFCDFNQDPEKGLFLLKGLIKTEGVCPSSRTFCSLIVCFSRLGKMDRVIDLLQLMSAGKLKYPFDNYVCSSVISGFVRIGEFELAVGFYENAVNSGCLRPNVVTCTSLVNAYCRLRDVNRVSDLVAWMEENELGFDVVFYSSWVYGCFREGLVHEAFRKYRAMVDKKVELDNVGYTILIDGFSKDGNVEKAVGFLHKMKRDGVEPNLITYTAIILGFCKKGKLDEAFAVFGMLKRLGIEGDEFTYAILIDGVCRRGDFEIVFRLLDEMEKKGINPSVVTYNTVINGLSKFGRTSEADDFSKGIHGDVITYSTLLRGYVEERNNSGILETKRRLEAAGIRMDVVLCNILIKALLMVGLFEDAFEIYKGLPQMDLSANSITYCTLIDGFCKAGRVDEALEIFDEFRKKTSNFSPTCYNRIVLGLCENGMVDMAVDVFIEYFEKDFPLDRKMYTMLIEAVFNRKGADGVLKMIYRMDDLRLVPMDIICNDAISFLCRKGFPEASYSILLAMRTKGLTSASVCYYSILMALLFEGKILLAELILASYLKIQGMSDLRVCKIIVNYLCLHDVKKALVFLSTMSEMKWSITIPITIFKTLTNNGRVWDAYELLVGAKNNVLDMNIAHYTIIIDALCKLRHINKALDLCTLAKKKSIDLNIVTYNSVINGLCRQGCLVEAFRLFDLLEKINVLPTEVTYGTLIDALVKEGLLQDAKMLFERMFLKNLMPNIHIYNSLINGYCKTSQLDEAIKLFEDSEVKGLEPDGFTIGALINGYCQKGDMEGALKLFFEFKSKELLPDLLGFMYLIRGLCGKGRMEESRSIIREMLKTQSVIDLLNRVNTEVESDSVENILLLLCERGRVNEAVAMLNEVVSLFFSNSSRHTVELETCSEDMHSMDGETDSVPLLSDVEKVENVLEICAGEKDGRAKVLKDFDSFYSLIGSLCSKGELTKANRLAKLLMEF